MSAAAATSTRASTPPLESYSGLRSTRARRMLASREPGEIAAILARADAEGRRVTFRAAGRSFDDQAMSDDTIVDVRGMNRIVAFDATLGELTVEPAVSWGEIVDLTLPHGLIPHILVTTPWASAGGALAANCLSRSSPRHGHVGDHVRSFRLLTVTGELLTCSRQTNADVFHAAIGGLGYFGLVTEITLGLKRIGDRIRVRTEIERHEGLPDFIAALTQASLADEPNDAVYSVFSLATPQRGAVLRSTYTDEPLGKRFFLHRPWAWYRPFAELLFASRLGNVLCHASYLHVFGGGPFVDDFRGYTFCMEGNERAKSMVARVGIPLRSLQPTYAVPKESVLSFLADATRLLRRFDVYPTLLDTLHRPADDFLLSSARDLPGFSVSLMFGGITASSFPRHERCLLALNDACIAAGGRLHLVKNVYGTRAQLRAMYGHAEAEMNRVKSRVDPRGVLQNDFFARVFG